MDKHYYSPIEMLKIAAEHAACTQQLLQNDAEIEVYGYGETDTFLPIASLMYTAFELTFKAVLLHDNRPVKQFKSLLELLELNTEFGFSKQELQLLKRLSRQNAFHKGFEYELWESREQQHIFCIEILALFRHMQTLMPVELHPDYL